MPRKPKTDDAPPASGDNSIPDLMIEALTWYAEKRADVASIQQEIATGLGRYETQGIDKDDLKFAYKMQKSDLSAAEIAAKLRRREEYLRWASIITVDEQGQASMAAGLEPKRPSAKAARKLELGRVQADAYNSQRAGGTLDDNPHTAGTEEYAVWAESFTQARADAAEEQEKAALPPAKRGRPANGTRPPQPPAETAEEATARAVAHLSGAEMPADPF